MTAEELLAANNICLSDTKPGRHYAICPRCSPTRSKAHQSAKCLGVTMDEKGVRFFCNHCDYAGGGYFNGKVNGHAQSNPFAAVYDYVDESGELLFQVCRKSNKDFPQRRPDGKGGWIWRIGDVRKVLYRLPEVEEAIANERVVLVVEGEKDVENLRAIGISATCSPGGAADVGKTPKWRPVYSESLRGGDIVVLNDNDAPGYAHADATASMSLGIAKRVRRLDLAQHWRDMPPKADISDWLAAGHIREELDALIDRAPDCGAASARNQPSSSSPWDDPDLSILDDRRGDLPDFLTDIFPPPIRGWLERAAHGAGVFPDHVAVPMLGVAGSLIGTARRVRASRSWSEPVTLWTALVAASGDRKTPGLNVTRRALDLIETEQVATIAAARLLHETRVQKAKEAAKKWKLDREEAMKDTPPRDPPSMPKEALDPGNFIEPRLYATDPTIEKLAALLQVRPRGMMLLRDELAGLYANMGRYSGGSDRPFWLEAWVGKRHVVERVSGTIVVDHLLVGVIGSFQPDKLARAFQGDEDGMYGRFLFGWPATPDYRPLTNEVAEIEPELQSALKALIRLPAEDADNVFTPQAIPLSQGAVERFEDYRRHVDKMKRALDGVERQWLVKSESQVLRLAGALTYLSWAFALGTSETNGLAMITADLEPREIGVEFMSAAIRLAKEYFWPHARAALRQIGLTDRHRNARRALRWIAASGKQEVSREDIRRDALGQALDAEQVQELIVTLVRWGWLKESTRTEGAGRLKRRWRVNPKLFSLGGTAGIAGNAEMPANDTSDAPATTTATHFRNTRNPSEDNS
jgi:Protein of unknown function (DUF3987)